MARLKKENWLDHGLQMLATDGFVALKADVLAKSLRVSRGSFYHHFTDLAAYHAELLEHWLHRTVLSVVERLEATAQPPLARLEVLIDLVAESSGGLEQAVRAWAFSDAQVRAVLTEVDRRRTAYVASLFHETGLEQPKADRAARLLYMNAVGYAFLGPSLTEDERAQARADLNAVAESVVTGGGTNGAANGAT